MGTSFTAVWLSVKFFADTSGEVAVSCMSSIYLMYWFVDMVWQQINKACFLTVKVIKKLTISITGKFLQTGNNNKAFNLH